VQPSIDLIAQAVRLGHPIALSVEDILATIRAMIDWGHRYKNMEAALGEGICMVLGRRLKESYWKKLMGKSGPRFKRVVLQLQNTDAASLSTQHASLCKLIVQTRVQQLRPSLLCLRSQATTPMLYAPALLSPQAAYREAYEEMYGSHNETSWLEDEHGRIGGGTGAQEHRYSEESFSI